MIEPAYMERASKLIRGLRLPGETLTAEELACAAWPLAAGKKIASRTRAAKLVRTRLVVEVEDQTWQRQLFALRHQVIANVARHIGPGIVEEVEFRIVPPRREPQRATAAVAALFQDEADSIADPVLRSIFKASRKRAGA
jgi:hypothetical protein